MAKKQATLFLLLVFIYCPLPRANGQTKDKRENADISGNWEVTFANKNTGDLSIAQEKQTLKVTLKIQDKLTLNGTGTVKANAAEWSVSISTSLRTVTWVFKAKIEGDKMSGEAQIGGAGSTSWTAAKKKIQ
jgi:hypothetical protein